MNREYFKIISYYFLIFILLLIVLSIHFIEQFVNFNRTKLDTYFNENNQLKRKIKKNKIVFLYSYDYKTLPTYALVNILIAKKYCDKHNYELLLKNHYPNDKISPYWLRVFDLVELSKKYPSNTIFVYLDIDATVNPKFLQTEIDYLLDSIDAYDKKNYHVYVGADRIPEVPMNSGVFFLRNTDITKKILDVWLASYNPKNWNKENNKWTCMEEENKPCIFGQSPSYEQTQLNYIYTNNIDQLRQYIKILHPSVCSNRRLRIPSFIYHFYGMTDTKRLTFSKNLFNKIVENS